MMLDSAEKPLVSFIIIFLNGEQYIRESIASIFAQTYPQWELLLVDDGSTAQSTVIAKEYARAMIRDRFNLDINFITKFHDEFFPNAQRLFVGYKEIKCSFLYPEFVRQSSYETQQNIAKDIGGFLSVLHSLPLSIVSQFGIPEKKLRKKYYLYHEQILVKEILPQLNLQEQEIISQLFGDVIKDINFDDNSSILHGDLNWDHLIFDETQNHLVGIIDFGGVFLGDPTRDFTTILVQFGEDFLQLILQFYHNKNQSNYSSSKFLNRIKLRHCCDCVSLIKKLNNKIVTGLSKEWNR